MLSLKIKREIERQAGKLVSMAEEMGGKKPEELTDTQIKNVMNVASSAECMEVVTNFIKYQIGRDKGWKEKNFGKQVIEEIDGKLKSIAEQVSKGMGEKGNKTEIWKKLVSLYLGYLGRYVKGGLKGD